MQSYSFFSYFVISLVVYLGNAAGLYLVHIAPKEVEENKNIFMIILSVFFILALGLFSYEHGGSYMFMSIIIALTGLIIALSGRLYKDMYFVFLALAYALSYVYSGQFLYVAMCIFGFGMLSSSINYTKTKNFKRILIRRLPFIVLVLFGYLLTLSIAL